LIFSLISVLCKEVPNDVGTERHSIIFGILELRHWIHPDKRIRFVN
jgi:hypothetical protein